MRRFRLVIVALVALAAFVGLPVAQAQAATPGLSWSTTHYWYNQQFGQQVQREIGSSGWTIRASGGAAYSSYTYIRSLELTQWNGSTRVGYRYLTYTGSSKTVNLTGVSTGYEPFQSITDSYHIFLTTRWADGTSLTDVWYRNELGA